MKSRDRNFDVKQIRLQELSIEKKEKMIQHLLVYLSILSFSIFLVLFFIDVLELTGKAFSVPAEAGYISELDIIVHKPVYIWSGLYGFALRLSGFEELMYKENLAGGVIERQDLFFNCLKSDAPGGPELFASVDPNVNLRNAVPATIAQINTWLNCSGKDYCAEDTFTRNMSIMIGDVLIENIPSTFTYKYTGETEAFDLGALSVDGSLVFVTHINASFQKGYSFNVTVNYQLMLPIPQNTTKTYYFFADPRDICPSGGIGEAINTTLSGYVFDEWGERAANATVNVGGYSALTNTNGFYNFSFMVLPGRYNAIARKEGYKPSIENISVALDEYILHKNFTIYPETAGGGEELINYYVNGTIRDSSGSAMSGVVVLLANSTALSSSNGVYGLYVRLNEGPHPIVAFKLGYNNYYYLLNFSRNITNIQHDITMDVSNPYTFPTGPYTNPSTTFTGPGVDQRGVSDIKRKVEQAGQDYWVSTKEIRKIVRQNTFAEEKVSIYNFKSGATMEVFFTISENLADFVKLDQNSLRISPNNYDSITLTVYGTKPIGTYTGTLNLKGSINQDIPVIIEIVEKKMPVETLLMSLNILKKIVRPGSNLRYKVDLQNLISNQGYKVTLYTVVTDKNNTQIFDAGQETVEIQNSLSLLREIKLPRNISEADYVLKVRAQYLNFFSEATAPFKVAQPIYLYTFFGIPLWILFIIIAFISFVVFNLFLYKLNKDRKKRYHLALEYDTLPKPGPRSIKLGYLAETTIPAYYDLDMLTTHMIVAGATGGGKSISAQVFVEEALTKGIAVVVFDPTAQWSGMLRKNEDKKMMSFFPKFKLKPTDARAYPGSVKFITNAREAINLKKFINPGQIQIFACSKLSPQEMDIFVASTIASIFKSAPDEFPGLRVMLVFDEVHRLLPKFGGSGKGFLQIERACREFRKWGYGVMLVSQVLSDFVGEIKANINTEVQMRVAEENDLKRVQERYGPEALKSLVRADVGVGMIQNAEYNRGRPYFVNLRPILHNTRRLSDAELEKYNHYNDIIEDMEFQIEQLEAEKVDTFDLKMELKLVKEKTQTGNFTVVDIYLEGLLPRLEKAWQAIGKKPKKKEIELVDESLLVASISAAQKDRSQWGKEQKKENETASPKANENNGSDNKEVKVEEKTNVRKIPLKKVHKKILHKHENKKPAKKH